jgi:hypothetical protein
MIFNRVVRAASLALAASLFLSAGANASEASNRTADRAALDRVLTGAAVGGEAMREMKQDFPADYNAMLDQALDLIGQPDAIAKAGQLGFETIRRLSVQHGPEAASAPSAEINAFVAAQAAVAESLRRENVKACVDYGKGGLHPGEQVSAVTQQRLSATVVTEFRAARAGLDHPTPHGELTDADVDAVRKQLVGQHLSAAAVALLMDGTGADKLSETEQCDASVALYAAFAALPPDAEARWGAHILMQTGQ